jgi:colanic acid/amylovoran biosynthesis glycosyltransferase
MRLLIVSACWPYRKKEGFLGAELAELVRHFDRLTVVPVHTARGTAQGLPAGVDILPWPLLSAGVLARAVLVATSRPGPVARSLFAIVRSREPGLSKNLAVAFKGLALAQWAIEHRIGHVHAYWLSTPATVAMIVANVAGISWSSTAHRWDIYERNALDVKARSVAFVRTISNRGAEDLSNLNPELASRVLHIPIGASIPKQPAWRGTRSETFRVVCPAALVPVKGHEDLLQAVEILRTRGVPVQCTFAGDGPLYATLERQIKQRSLEQFVRMAGFVPQERLYDLYRAGSVDAVVLASREDGHVMEGIPAALVEAMAYGVPVVATSSGSITELVDDSCGRVVPTGDPKALADALCEIYERPAQAVERAALAFDRVSQLHDVRRQMKRLSEKITVETELVPA